MSEIMTVQGRIDSSEFGFALSHEHILVDFGGAATAGRHRYVEDEVVARMKPFLEEARSDGVCSFVDCSPMFLARDPRVLRRLSEATGMHIVTNTGQYKEPFLPDTTFAVDAQQLAAQWIDEWVNGIEDTDVRPGFIKTAVEAGPLAETQVKVMEAAAITSRNTGLTIGTHTCRGIPALQILRLLDRHGVDPSRWIFIHAHVEDDYDLIRMVARAGAWIELDGVGNAADEKILSPLLKLLDEGFEDQVLLSQDSGWYAVGEPGGGSPRPYTYITRTFLPLVRGFGLDDAAVDRLMVTNPARAFSIRE